eukprot:4950631-Pyramimonas_sp.AAC.1
MTVSDQAPRAPRTQEWRRPLTLCWRPRCGVMAALLRAPWRWPVLRGTTHTSQGWLVLRVEGNTWSKAGGQTGTCGTFCWQRRSDFRCILGTRRRTGELGCKGILDCRDDYMTAVVQRRAALTI